MVWSEQNDSPPATAFRNLVREWLKAWRLWKAKA